MEELLEIKHLIQSGQYNSALLLVSDLEEMGKKGITHNIESYATILLLHLIKQIIEQRTTKSWDTSIRNSVRQIRKLNARPKGKGNYLNPEELEEAIQDSVDEAIDRAAMDVKEGIYDYRAIEQMIDRQELIELSMQLVESDRP